MSRVFVVDGCIYDYKTVCVAGCAGIYGFGEMDISAEMTARCTIAGAKRNRFDNFTGNSLSHIITPTIIIVADSQGEIKQKPAVWICDCDWYYMLSDNITDVAILWDNGQVCYG